MNFTLKNKIVLMIKPVPRLKISRSVFVFIMCGLIHLFPVSLQAQNSTVSLNMKNATVEEVLNAIESKTEYRFLYNKQIVDVNRKVTVNASKEEVRQVLTKVFEGSGITFSVDGKQIVLRKAEKVPVKQNTIRVTGVVTDFNGQEIVGATVKLEGTTAGTITDIDGKFSIEAPLDGKLNISYIGYNAEIVQIDGKSNLKVILNEDVKALDELVVIGYGTQRRSLVTSAISKLTVDESIKRQVASPSQLLNGRIAGISTLTGSGNLGSGERMSIRGASSISAGNEPLYVIDGIPITNSNANLFNFGESMSALASLNTADIESIEVLKDAASASIYGSRATNGVIVITTKSGKKGRSDVHVNATTGLSTFPNIGKVKMANADLFVKDYNAGVANYNRQYGLSIGDPSYKIPISNPFGDLPDTDWMSLITQTGRMLNLDASFSGGTQSTKYYIGTNYSSTEGIIVTNKLNKINLKAKISHEFNPWLEVGTNTSGNYVKNFQIPGANMGSTVIGRAIEQRPFDRPYKPDGGYYIGGTDELTRHNILQVLNEQDAYIENFRFLGNYYALLKYKDKLSWKYSFSTDVNYTYDYTYYNENHPYGMGNGRLIDQNRLIQNLVSENVINYNDKFKDFSLGATLGHSFQKVITRDSQVDGRGFPSPSFSVASVAGEILGSTSAGVFAMESYFGRATLAYQERYILTGTFRTDGSSKFASHKRWGWFPSVSLGWNISKEDFMKDSDADVKFRISYGKTGNQEGIGTYAYQGLMSGGRNYGGKSGIAVSTLGNNDLTWEKADQYDVGFDIALFKGKVNMIIDAYQKDTKDLLYSMPIHGTSGFSSIISNIGSMRNRGIEFTLNTHFTFNKFEWLSQFNIARNKNKIISLIDETNPISIGSNRALKVGEEMGAFFIFQMEGLYQYDGEVPQPQYDLGIRAGDVKWRDMDDNGIINDNDRVMTGSSNPDFYGGWNNTFRYGNLQLDVFLTYMYGNDVYAEWMNVVANAGGSLGKLEEYASRAWTGQGTTNKYPRAIRGVVNNNRNSNRWLKDGSFIRARSISLGYNFPKKVLDSIKLKSLRVYCQADNLFLLTRYPGWDPEVSNNLDPRFQGVDLWNVPQPRMFMIGTNISF